MKKYLRFLVTTNDLFNVVTIIIALILSWLGTSTIFDPKIDLNSANSIFLYAAVATLTSSVLDPCFEIFKLESKKKKLFTVTLGVIAGLCMWVVCYYNISIFQCLQSISRRGGFSAISISLLLLNVAYINYQIQVLKENEIEQEKQKNIKLLKENLEYKRRDNRSE